MLQYSKDGGVTWSNEQWRALGKIGQHKRTIYWDRLGRARDMTFRVAISDPVKVVLINAIIYASEGRN